ncbi:MAG: hypothetical protein ABI165_07270 [Bryobacteraceae bacterium]
MLERYTERARGVIFCARNQAAMDGGSPVDIHHLLLGILDEDPDVVARFRVAEDPLREKIARSGDILHHLIKSLKMQEPLSVPFEFAGSVLQIGLPHLPNSMSTETVPPEIVAGTVHLAVDS